MKQLIVNAKTDEERIALIENGRLVEVFMKDIYQQRSPGSIFRGRVRNVVPGLEAAFVDIGGGINGYLHRNDVLNYLKAIRENRANEEKSISSFITEGEEVIVQIVKEGNEHKAPKLTMNLEFKTSSLVYKPYENHVGLSKKITDEKERKRLEQFAEHRGVEGGLIIRTDAARHSNETLQRMLEKLVQTYLSVLQKKGNSPVQLYQQESFVEEVIRDLSLSAIDEIVYDSAYVGNIIKRHLNEEQSVQLTFHSGPENVFSLYHIEEELEKALRKLVWLKNGSFIVIEETEAMTVIDVNTGKFSGKYTYRDTVLQTNKEAAIEIARQLRLRNISGIVIIDFIDMKEKRDQEEIIHVLKKQLTYDRTFTKIIGFTELNLLQLTRKKVRKSLSELMTSPCRACGGTGRSLSNETVLFRLQRELLTYQKKDVEAVLIEAHPEVIDLVQEGPESLLNRLEEMLHMKIFFVSNPLQRTYAIRMEGSLSDVQKRMRS